MEQLLDITERLSGVLSILIYIGSALATFSLAFAKTFQMKNIVAGHVKSAFFMSWLVTGLGVADVSFIVMGGWWALLSTGIGGSIGVVISMKMHTKLYKTKQTA